jgi:hypothetical protein
MQTHPTSLIASSAQSFPISLRRTFLFHYSTQTQLGSLHGASLARAAHLATRGTSLNLKWWDTLQRTLLVNKSSSSSSSSSSSTSTAGNLAVGEKQDHLQFARLAKAEHSHNVHDRVYTITAQKYRIFVIRACTWYGSSHRQT